MKIFEMLKGKKAVGVAEYEAALAANSAELKLLRDRLADLAARRENVLMEQGETALDKIDAEAKALQEKLSKLELADSGTRKRLEAARAGEQAANDEALAKRARTEVLEPLILALREYHSTTVASLEAAKKAADLDAELHRINETLRSGGRADLEITAPLAAIHEELVRYAKEEGFAFPISEAWQTVAQEDGIDAVPEHAWLGLPPFPKVPDIRRITIPDYCEGGVIRWQQPFRFA